MAEDKVYLPRMRTRIGRAGYKGKNIVQYDQDNPPKTTPTVVTAPAVKAPTKAIGKAAPKAGIKPLKTK